MRTDRPGGGADGPAGRPGVHGPGRAGGGEGRKDFRDGTGLRAGPVTGSPAGRAGSEARTARRGTAG
ncbi:hypothetical protein B7767_18085, partial [Streptomyces sp. 13-12-16]